MIKSATKQAQHKAYLDKYFDDPIAFQCDILDVQREHVWAKMEEVAQSVWANQRTAVYAGHGVSKTYEAARLTLAWLYTHIPSTVITTAPVYDQVEKLLWKEIHVAHANARIPLGGRLTKTQLDVDPDRKWFAYGFSTRPDTVTGEATRIQGYHNKWVLIVFDEAAGIQPQIWKAVESLLNSPNCHILAIGNPTSADGEFASLEENHGWHFIRISVKDTPNFKTGEEIIPQISGRAYEEQMRVKYGEESSEYGIRILGRKPAFTAGTFLGEFIKIAENEGRVNSLDAMYNPSLPVYTFWDTGDMYTAIWFAQFVKERIHLIDFEYNYEGKGLPYFSVMLQNKGYKYAEHWSLPDIVTTNARSFQTGQYTRDAAAALNIDFQIIKLSGHRVDQLNAAKDIFYKCYFSEKAAEGVAGLKDWRKKKNEALSTSERPVYFDDPMKTWGRHCGDSFCGMAMAYRYQIVVKDQYIGYPFTVPAAGYSDETLDYYPLGVSR